MPDENERRLWLSARDGDRAALDQLLRQHERNVYRFGLRMCGDEESAKDVLQNTLLMAFEQFGSYRGEARVSTWLYSIARSFCARHHRRTRSAPLHDVPLDAPDGAERLTSESDSPAEASEKAEMAELVGAAIAALPESYREVVLLRDVEGLSAAEASTVLDLEVSALKSRLHRGRQLLKRSLATLLRDTHGVVGAARACPALVDDLSRLDGRDIDQAACASIERHIIACASCAESLGDLHDAAALCKRLPSGDVPGPVKKAVLVALTDVLARG